MIDTSHKIFNPNQMPFITIKLFANLKSYSPENGNRYPISPGMSVEDLIDALHIPQTQAKLIFINGVKATLGTKLKGNDRVGIFPPIGGG